MDRLARRVLSRFLAADQAPGARKRVKQLAQPINKPKGIDRGLVKDFGETEKGDDEETMNPERKDIRPKDVFSPTPDVTSVQNLVQTGKDLSKALDKQVPKDKGYDNIRNLSQYLIWSEGGAEGGPVGKK